MKKIRASLFCFGMLGVLGASALPAMSSEMSPAIKSIVEFDKSAAAPSKKYRIGYLTECVDNPYCLARLAGLKDAAAKYGFEFKIFDANFNPATQAKVVENAVTEGFDGYIFGPAAGQPACGLWKRLLQPTGKPVVTVDVPMCGDADYTAGLVGTVSMNTAAHFNKYIDEVFSTCKQTCKVAAIGGFVGSDLFVLWQNALKAGEAKYPNVKLVVNEAANYDPRVALKKVQDALLAHPDINIVLSSWDDMTRGAEQAVVAAGKTPGSDIQIYSQGATKIGVAKVASGTWAMTMAFLPYEESYYAAAALMMGLQGEPVNAFVDEALLPEIVNSTGTVFITRENAAKYEPRY